MKLRSARFAQQVRLWLYTALLVLVVTRVMSRDSGLAEFVMLVLIGALFYSEVCPVCGRLSWWEFSPLRRWPNALWIGAECRRGEDGNGSPSSYPEEP
jgi:hypothetical protein